MHVRNRLFANGTRWLLISAALLGCTGVGLAAYTSHGLGCITDPVAREAARATLQQAVQQQLLHAVVPLALAWAALGIWLGRRHQRAASGLAAGLEAGREAMQKERTSGQ